MRRATATALVALSACTASPRESIVAGPATPLAFSAPTAIDASPKGDFRMVPPEVYVRTYLQLFGGVSPSDAQKIARGAQGGALFDSWNDYVSALGFPDYRFDVPRQTQTNALMMATFERLGVALCDRAVERELASSPRPPVAERHVFAFDEPVGAMGRAEWEPRFDVLHRTFLGYPAALAPAARSARFLALFTEVVRDHVRESPKSKFTPSQAGWAAVCYGLVRHPEFVLY